MSPMELNIDCSWVFNKALILAKSPKLPLPNHTQKTCQVPLYDMQATNTFSSNVILSVFCCENTVHGLLRVGQTTRLGLGKDPALLLQTEPVHVLMCDQKYPGASQLQMLKHHLKHLQETLQNMWNGFTSKLDANKSACGWESVVG